MVTYPPELSQSSGKSAPSNIRVHLAAILVAMSLDEWDGEEITEDDIYDICCPEPGEDDGTDYPVYRGPHELFRLSPTGALGRATAHICGLLVNSILKGEIASTSLRTTLEGKLDPHHTWVGTDRITTWCNQRNIQLHDLFYDYLKVEESIAGAGQEASDTARFRAENESELRLAHRLSDDPDWKTLYLERVVQAKFEAEPTQQRNDTRLLATRERNTLLCIIAALCKEANVDYQKVSKAAGSIRDIAHTRLGLAVGETTIENHLKAIPDALAARSK